MLPLPAGREASSGFGATVYERHRPECTLLYQLIEEYYPAFEAHLAGFNPLPESRAPPPRTSVFDRKGYSLYARAATVDGSGAGGSGDLWCDHIGSCGCGLGGDLRLPGVAESGAGCAF